MFGINSIISDTEQPRILQRSSMVFVLIPLLFLSRDLVISTFFIILHYYKALEQEKLYKGLTDIVNKTKNLENRLDDYSTDKIDVLKYEDIYKQNDDMVGWIKIEGTKINYPVMQTIEHPDFYLKHGFDKSYSDYGCPYIQANCDVKKPSDNLIIYGHNMKDGSMFAGLIKFQDISFWEKHKTISFDTPAGSGVYEIVAVFKTVVYTSDTDSFKYYNFIDATNEAEFNEYIEKCKKLALYDTKVAAKYGDKLITLSTCEYSKTNGRLVVVAKRVPHT